MNESPGFLPKFLASLGILAYVIADFLMYVTFQTLQQEPVTLAEGLGSIVVVVLALAFGAAAAILGAILSLLGQIWRQTSSIVYVSTASYGIFLLGLGWLTISAFSQSNPGEDSIGLLGLWVFLLLTMLAHIKGILNLRSSS